MRFHSIGKSIQRVGGKRQQSHQNGVNRDDVASQTRAKNRNGPKAEL